MLKIVILLSLYTYSSFTYSQELSVVQCEAVKKIANHEIIATNFNILHQGVSQADIELNHVQGLVRSQLAYEAAALKVNLSDYASSIYNEKCLRNSATRLANIVDVANES